MNNKSMDLNTAMSILREYVKLDRSTRQPEAEQLSDFDAYCEEKCVAIETVLNYILAEQSKFNK